MKTQDTASDGNCLFRALSVGLSQDGSQSQHLTVRKDVVAYTREHSELYMAFLLANEAPLSSNRRTRKARAAPVARNTGPYAALWDYCDRMENSGEWGGNMELSAFAGLYRRNVELYDYSLRPPQKTLISPMDGAPDLAKEPVRVYYTVSQSVVLRFTARGY